MKQLDETNNNCQRELYFSTKSSSTVLIKVDLYNKVDTEVPELLPLRESPSLHCGRIPFQRALSCQPKTKSKSETTKTECKSFFTYGSEDLRK